jgi:glycosyltransferase involved in cell wall biosynthesis
MISVIMPAHNEAAVIARALRALVADAQPDELEIIVVCNGCSDNTADVARRFAPVVRVLETDVPSKTNALNLGEAIARSFPRVYADADIVIGLDAVRALAARLAQGDVKAVAPTPVTNATGCSRLVRAYYTARARLPSARQGIGGSGVYALSAAGRARFAAFPDVTADDAFVRLQFAPRERATIPSVQSTVYAPRTLRNLVKIRTRIYHGIAELAARFPELMANADNSNDRALIAMLKSPTMWPAAATYLAVNVVALCRARLRRNRVSAWTHDRSSRDTVVHGTEVLCRGDLDKRPIARNG